MTTQELIDYYANLLVIEYIGKSKAYATIETLVTPVVMPQNVIVDIDGGDSSNAFDDVIDGGNAATVFFDDTLDGGSASEDDLILPLAVQGGFDLTSATPAVGVQLDILGKYAGVTRNVLGLTRNITLGDADFLSLIKMAVATNSAGSSLATIQQQLIDFFGAGHILVFDLKNMQMSYLISTALGSLDLIEAFVAEGLLPKPMGVQLASVIYAPVINMFFGFRTYQTPAFNSEPFNTYGTYHTDWPFLTYADAVA